MNKKTMSGSLGFGRPHSSDSWSAQRNLDLPSRIHSVPRYSRSPSKYGEPAYSSDFDIADHPHYFKRYLSPNGESSLLRSSVRSYDRIKPNTKDLKRKMVFNLHEEIKKPLLTIVLEEISDVNIITDMCLNTMTAMMKSKAHRKFLHHMNNNAPLVDKCFDNRTSNSNSIHDVKKMMLKAMSKSFDDTEYSRNGSLRRNDLPKDFHNYSKEAERNRKQRADEIEALRKLKEKLPPLKRKLKIVERNAPPRKSVLIDKGNARIIVTQEEKKKQEKTQTNVTDTDATDEDDQSSHPIKKPVTMTAEEALRCKWLRLTEEQIATLEDMMRAEGKDPGWHNHSHPVLTDVFNHTEDFLPIHFEQENEISKNPQ